MSWNCAQLEQRLEDYLEGRLTPAEQAAADAHARACPRCAEWGDARRAALWLRQLEVLEAPPGLETRILALTVTPPPKESAWAVLDRGWRALMQPRFALSLAAAIVSLTLVFNAFGVRAGDLRAADLNPVNIYRGLERQTQLTYGRTVRFLNDLRLVYEIRSRLEERGATGEQQPRSTPPQKPDQPKPKNEKKPENSSDKGRAPLVLAFQGLGGLGELR
ncbi:MAG: zf-HC2 domain-containing protein [Candidatus Acidiferrales bacterium]